MKNISTTFFFFIALLFSAQQTEIPLLKYEDLEKKIQNEKADFTVVNFWSTTCAPCVRELPDFMTVNNAYRDNPNFKMILVSLDRVKDIERVRKFIADKKLTAEVVILDDNKRMNSWIPRFDQNWGGEIPVTVFYSKNEKVAFHNGEMHLDDLQKTVHKYLENLN